MLNLKKYFIPGLFVLPMIIHWLMPWGIESKMYLSILGIKLFIPDFLYIIYIIYCLNPQNRRRSLSPLKKAFLFFIIYAIVAYSWLCLIFNGIEYVNSLIINNLSFVWFTALCIFLPLSKDEISRTKPFLFSALTLLVFEVIVYGLGIMHYSKLTGQDFNGVMRISTTIGAATGTAVIIGLLGAICLSLYSWSIKGKIIVLLFSSIGIFYTMSRGTSLLWCMFIGYYFYVEYFRNFNSSQRRKSFCYIAIGVSVFYFVGGFDPILARFTHMEKSSDPTAERGGKFETSMKMIEESIPWGYGLGQVMPEKIIEEDFPAPHHFAPHNVYNLLAIELGWPGLFLFLLLFFILFKNIDYKSPLAIYLCLVFIINANTESILLDSEFAALILFAFMAITKYKPTSNKISNYEPYSLYNKA